MNKTDLTKRYRYGASYIDDLSEFRAKIAAKTIIPYQVEVQPPPTGRKICWLECPYCYGGSAYDDGARFPKERCMEIMQEIADGGVRKVIFAGYATDPLNCDYIDDLLELAISNQQIFGFNTKALKVSDKFLTQLSRSDIEPSSYMSISVDAGSNETYASVHDVKGRAKLYDRVLELATLVGDVRKNNGKLFDLSATYLINSRNCSPDQVSTFIHDFKKAGCNLLRFTFAQPPKDIAVSDDIVPTPEKIQEYIKVLAPLIEAENSQECVVMLIDADADNSIFDKPRTLPCVARFTYPTIGFDGWLYHCSQSSAPNFHQMAIGDLNNKNFWELLYDYNGDDLPEYFSNCSEVLVQGGCRCDRKEHLLNARAKKSGLFEHG